MGEKSKGKVILYLMRHGQTVLNKAEITQGWCDGALTEEGIKVAESVGIGLSDIKFRAVYSSDLGRAVETAKIIIRENKVSGNVQLKQLKGLREVNFGKYEGKPEMMMYRDILSYLHVSSFEEAIKKDDFQKQYCNICASLDETMQAEDYDSVIKRVIKTLKDICADNCDDSEKNILVVAHGGMIRLIINYFDKNADVMNVDNASISKIIYENGDFTIESVNDNSYCGKGRNVLGETKHNE